MKLGVWLMETRPQFLTLSLVLAFLGTCIVWFYGEFNIGHAILAFGGLTLAHISVNTLNDYFDFRSGLDLKTKRTPFSGGSGMLPAGLLTPKQVFWLRTGSLLLAVPIGVYFTTVRGWLLLPLLLIAAISIIAYTPVFLKIKWPEWIAGPSGILVHNLLLLNEFPDAEADSGVGRKTLPIILGKKKAGIIYSALTALVYLWLIGGVVAGQMPVLALALVALLTIPFALKAIKGALNPYDMDRLVPARSPMSRWFC